MKKTTKKTAKAKQTAKTAKTKKTAKGKAKKTTPKTHNETTHIIAVLDRSGSMQSVAKDAIGGYNNFLAEQRKGKDKATISGYLFDDKFEKLYNGEVLNIKDVPDLTDKEFIPRNSTALLDAIGKAVVEYKATGNKADKVLMIIVTDGEENASREFSRKDIADLISSHKKMGWQFLFLCSTEDALTTSQSLNISANNTFQFVNNSLGNQELYSKISFAASSYRGMATQDAFYADANGNLKSDSLITKEDDEA